MFVEKFISKRDVNNIQVITMKLCNWVVRLSFPFYKIVDILKDFFPRCICLAQRMGTKGSIKQF